MIASALKTTLLSVGVLFACQRAVLAHAFLDHADPKVGSDVETSPDEVRIWFTEEIEPAFSSVQVLDSAGKQVDKKDFHLDSKDKKLAIVSLPSLPAGKYKVVWQVVSTDTHKTQGDFTFHVNGAKPGAALRPSPATATRPATSTEPVSPNTMGNDHK